MAFSGSHSRAQPTLCGGWPATGTLVRKTSRVRPRRLRADDATIMLKGVRLVKSLEIVPSICFPLETLSRRDIDPICSDPALNGSALCIYVGAPREDRLGGRTGPEAFAGRATTPAGPPGWLARNGTPVSGQRRSDAVSFGPAERVRRGFLAAPLGMSREPLESKGIVSDERCIDII